VPLRADALEGVTVVDFSGLLPGPFCTMMLAELGARVVRVEPVEGDWSRHLPPSVAAGDGGYGAFFDSLHRGKESVAVDLKHPVGLRLAHHMLSAADVVVEGFRPGVLARMKLAPTTLQEAYPRLIGVSISGFGASGPDAARAGHDVTYLARSGLLGTTGPSGGSPGLVGAQIADLAGGALHAAFAIAVALYDRENTGRGSWIDVSMTDGAAALLRPWLATWSAASGAPSRGEDVLTGGQINYGVYRTSDDRFMAVGALEPKFWSQVCAAMGCEDLIAQVGSDEADVKARLVAAFSAKPAAHWQGVFEPLDACVELVQSWEEVIDDAHLRARSCIVDVDGRSLSRNTLTPPRDLGPAPRLGEHTKAWALSLGLDEATVSELVGGRILEVHSGRGPT
jgi:alpha-methylacyl-CoA racemase